MLALLNSPGGAYGRAAFDIRVRGAGPTELVHVCLDHVTDGLTRALRAERLGDNAARADGLARAHAGLVALEMGVDAGAPLAHALLHLFQAARGEIVDAMRLFTARRIEQVRTDFAEIAAALRAV